MSLKPLAAKASVFNSNFVDDFVSSVSTEPDFTKDRFYIDFFKLLGYFYDNIVGLEAQWRVHLGFVQTSPAGGASAKEKS